MKRKFETIYTTPPLESTMMIETGAQLVSPAVNVNDGNVSNDCIGNLPNIPVSASLNNGTSLFQYNQFFWNKDVFSFNYSNCAVFIAIAYYQGTHSKNVSFVFYPIFLPRTALATFQSLQNSVTSDPVVRKYLINDLLYYLNGAFTSFNFDSAPGSIGDVGIGYPAGHPLYSGPSLYASYVKGFLKDPTDDHPNFPIFQDGKEPPLKFIYVSSNNQIALVKNPVFWDDSDNYESGASIAFQLINPEMEFVVGTNNPTCKIAAHRGGSNPTLIANSTKNFFAAGCFNTSDISPSTQSSKGWCGQGAYGLGFGMTFDETTKSYSDIFGTDDYEGKRFDLFNQTNWDTDSNLSFSSTSSFETWASQNSLETFIVMAPKICSLLPSRYLIVESEILTRDQKIKPLSNNPALASSSILSVVYLDLDYNRTKIDATLSGSDIKKVGSFTPVVHIDPSYSIQSIDINIKDEYGNYLQNFRSSNPSFQLHFENGYSSSSFLSSASTFDTGNYVSLLEGEMAFNNGVFDGASIPAWLASYNPNTVSSNTNPLVAPFSTYLSQFAYGLYARSEAGFSQSGNSVVLKGNYTPNIPYSANIIHFGRLLGD